MALTIKTAEADQLAQSLAQLTGESVTEAVTAALRERLDREVRRRRTNEDLVGRLTAYVQRIAPGYDTRPVTQEEWDAALGEES